MNKTFVVAFALALALVTALARADDILPDVPDGAQAMSLMGEPLMSAAASQDSLAKLAAARADYEDDPSHAENIIWFGRRTAYTGDYRRAIEIYSEGIRKHPGDARFYRHRGHRYISIREFDRAIADLEHAAKLIDGTENETEPDGLPNALNIPVSSLHGNIWYHLGLAYYLKHDWDNAFRAYQSGFEAARNDDNRVSTSHWRYMILRRAGRDAEAADVLEDISPDMNVIENHVYHRLCLFYKGEIEMSEITGDDSDNPTNSAAAYGVANWFYYNGDVEEANARLKRHLESRSWSAFGFIAAEADIASRQTP
jgi:tetratricopeptide (TPR) repeat protein